MNPRTNSRAMLTIISTLAQAQHGMGSNTKKAVWSITNFPVEENVGSEFGSVPQVSLDQAHNSQAFHNCLV